MQLRLEPRALQSRATRYASPVIAAALTLVMGFVLFGALGKNPIAAFYAFFIAPISSINGVAELFLKASPLVLIAIGLAIGFRSNVWTSARRDSSPSVPLRRAGWRSIQRSPTVRSCWPP